MAGSWGQIALSEAEGLPVKMREFESSGDCAELVDAMDLAISLAIRPELAVDGSTDEPATPSMDAESELLRACLSDDATIVNA